MAKALAISVCIRCGNPRILSKSWVEKTEKGNPVTHVVEICADKECQKIVDATFAAQREKKLLQLAKKTASQPQLKINSATG